MGRPSVGFGETRAPRSEHTTDPLETRPVALCYATAAWCQKMDSSRPPT